MTFETKPVKIMDTIFRDASQSKVATRMKIEDMLPLCEKLNRAGYYAIEMWGGATFDSCIRFLDEDPWDRASILKEAMPNVKMQMVIRGQNLVGYKNYADDVVTKFVECAADNRIDIFRVFDALDDVRNMQKVIEVTKRVGKTSEGTICYTISPVHTVDMIIDKARQLEDLGCDIFCLKDMSGLMAPYVAYDIVKALKGAVDIPVHVHTHDTCGMGAMTCLKAVEAGADMIDTVLSPYSEGTGQPPTESIVVALQNTPYDTGMDLEVLVEAADIARERKKNYKEYETDLGGVDAKILVTQIPGGVMSNLMNQLKEIGHVGKIDEIKKEIPRVREDLGYINLVTPTSQIICVQATVNVVLGGRYKVVTKEVQNILRGGYGLPPGPLNKKLQRKVLGDGQPMITCRPADLLPNEFDKYAEESKPFARRREDVITYAIFPDVAREFFSKRSGSS